jgi:hypothetical protein
VEEDFDPLWGTILESAYSNRGKLWKNLGENLIACLWAELNPQHKFYPFDQDV